MYVIGVLGKLLLGLLRDIWEWFNSLPASIKWAVLASLILVWAGITINNRAYDRGVVYQAGIDAAEIADLRAAILRQNEAVERFRAEAEADKAKADKRVDDALRIGKEARQKETARGAGADAMNEFFGGVFK